MGTTFRPPVSCPAVNSAAGRAADRTFELKSEIHRKLIGVLNLERVSSIPKDRLRDAGLKVSGIEVPPQIFDEVVDVNL